MSDQPEIAPTSFGEWVGRLIALVPWALGAWGTYAFVSSAPQWVVGMVAAGGWGGYVLWGELRELKRSLAAAQVARHEASRQVAALRDHLNRRLDHLEQLLERPVRAP